METLADGPKRMDSRLRKVPAAPRAWSRIGICAVLLFALSILRAAAAPIDAAQLDPARHYQLARIDFSGLSAFSAEQIKSIMTLKERPWYQIWKPLPPFSKSSLEDDLSNIRRFYEAHGYYDVATSYRLEARRNAITVLIAIHQGRATRVAVLRVTVAGNAPTPRQLDLALKMPLKEHDIFDQTAYQDTAQTLLNTYKSHGYAHAVVQRRAIVTIAERRATVYYQIIPGERCVFGTTAIVGLHKVSSELVRRQLVYKTGELFDIRKLAASREALVALNLFNSVDIQPGTDPTNGAVIPITVALSEGPKHTINGGIGYNTQTQFNATLGWNDYNFIGGGRQFSVTGAYSNVTSVFDAKLLQPDFITPLLSLTLEGSGQQQSYQTYTAYIVGLDPHLDYKFTRFLTGALGWRLEYLKFNSVNPSTIAAIGGFRSNGILSGPFASLNFDDTEDPFNPQQGERVSLLANVSSHSFGADYRYWRALADARKYVPLGWRTVLAGRARIGLEDTLSHIDDIPLSERFYSGGEGSVRGYGLRRIGPLSLSNDPLGGRSLVETSVELRRPIVWKLIGAVFFDCGQVALQSFDLRVDSLQCGYGPSLGLNSPVGPINFYLGFPTQKPRGDSNWQFYLSIGQYF